MKEKLPHSRKPSHRRVCGEFWHLRGQHNREEKKTKQNNNNNPQNMHLTTTTSRDREVAQVLLLATSKLGLGRNAQAASSVLSVRTRPECPENNLRELR